LHTDLPASEAKALLGRLERMLALISKYWGQPLKDVIECYVVQDLNNWPDDVLDVAARDKIRQRAGITRVAAITLNERPLAAKAVVYACGERGTTEHEAVHAYCGQAFGSNGPLWYAEGMAEMGKYWRENDASVNCHPVVAKYLRGTPPKSLGEIVHAREVTGDSWKNYAWRWALCHLLANNTNYRERFRPLGLGYLTGQPVSFEQSYGPMAAEIDFEYRFFLQNVDKGYRVDLCSWDWTHKFAEPSEQAPLTCRVAAARGWQPSGVSVTANQRYHYAATGSWRLGAAEPSLSADGENASQGRLVGVIFRDFSLGTPFDLGIDGTFVAPADGQLYLRCKDSFNALADNRGSMTVKIRRAAEPAK
jgi:hypothetical protein